MLESNKFDNWVKRNKWIYGVLFAVGGITGILLMDHPIYHYFVIGAVGGLITLVLYVIIFRKRKWQW